MDPRLAIRGATVDLLDWADLGEAEERALHHLALIAQGYLGNVRQEHVELIVARQLGFFGHGKCGSADESWGKRETDSSKEGRD
jgi:hypothetical protein